MATNPRPTTEFHINYGALNTPDTARTLNPVLIAPRYDLHSYEEGYEDAYLGNYVGGTALTGNWPGKGSEDSTANIDIETAAAYIKRPVVQLNNSAITGILDGEVRNQITTSNSLVKGVGTYEDKLRDFSVAVGDTVVITVPGGAIVTAEVTGITGERSASGAVVAYNTIFINRQIIVEDSSDSSGSSGSDGYSVSMVFSSNKLTGDYVKLPLARSAFASTGVTVPASVSITVGDEACTVTSGEVYVNYRELVTEYALNVVAASATGASRVAGIADPRNPLGLMYAAASQVSNGFFYMVATAGTTEADYVDAVNYAAQFEDLYAFVTYEDTPVIYAAKVAAAAKYSNPLIAQFKKVWYAPTIENVDDIYVADSTGNALTASINSSSVATLSSGTPSDNGVVPGDYMMVRDSVPDGAGEYSWKKYLITKIVDNATIYLDGAPATALTKVEFVRNLTNAEYAHKLAAVAAGIDNARVNMVWCSGDISVLGFSGVKPTVVAAIEATTRASLPPHAPMSGLGVTGVTLNDKYKFTDVEYEILNEGGVWVVSNNSYRVATNYHQITTLTDGTVAEEDSCVSAGDAIVRELRNALSPLANGSVNVTDQLLDAIRLKVTAVMTGITGRSYGANYGPLVINYSILRLERPESNNAAIMMEMDIDTPQPLLKGQFYFNII